MDGAKYCYRPLISSNSIRLLKIEPGLAEDPVSCILEQHDNNAPPYSALSYYWGNPERTRLICLGGTLIGIHETLWEFLDEMRMSSNTEARFWTDFLCLDQANIPEINEQVQRMGDIYAGAEQTLSWLGREGSPAAIRIEDSTPVENLGRSLELIAERVSLKREAVQSFFSELPDWATIIDYKSSVTPEGVYLKKASAEVMQLGYGQLGQPLVDVLSLPYWTRVWIVQEVAKAKVVKLIFGSVSIDFDDFFLAYKCRFYHEVRTSKPRFGVTSGTKIAIQARAAVMGEGNRVSMHRVLQWGRLCEATKPVDRIYGLFGLLSLDGTRLTVRYDRDITSIFWDVVFACRISFRDGEDREYVKGQLGHFAELLPLIADSLGCSPPFSLQSLRCYHGKVEDPPLDRHITRLATRMVSVLLNSTMEWVTERDSWETTHFPARFLQSYLFPSTGLSRFSLTDIKLAANLLDREECDGVDDRGKIHASIIALELARNERRNLRSGD